MLLLNPTVTFQFNNCKGQVYSSFFVLKDSFIFKSKGVLHKASKMNENNIPLF